MTDLKACFLVENKLAKKPKKEVDVVHVEGALINFWANCSKEGQLNAMSAFKHLEDMELSDSEMIHLAKYILFNKTDIRKLLPKK